MWSLRSDAQRFLLALARRAIEARFAGETIEAAGLDEEARAPALRAPAAVFVSIHCGGRLRGCVGSWHAARPLVEAVIESAESAAFRDPRFPPLRREELPEAELEISVLEPPVETPAEQIEAGRHGVMVSQGVLRALLLPQVATAKGWSAERLLEECCAKAGLDSQAWRGGAKVEAFTAQVFSQASVGAPLESAKRVAGRQ